MQEYKNLGGKSAVSRYESGKDYIIIEYRQPSRTGGTVYKYTYSSAGEENVEKMKELADIGAGLADYVQVKCRKLYESKH